jgi:transcriptional regulator with XRE-family HTH domain
MQLCNVEMQLIQKSAPEIHRDLVASGVFERVTQSAMAQAIGVNQGTISRIANGEFKRVNKSVLNVCRYAQISTVRASNITRLRSLVTSAEAVNDPEKRKLMDIIRLAVDLLERP